MIGRKLGLGFFAIVLGLTMLPAAAWAQSQIVGTVSDDTGGVLPGVTVEASSPVLTEQVRTTYTGGDGRYTLIPLPPGTYTITYTLPGFRTAVRENFDLPGDFVATVNVQMLVGGLEETVTVSGQSPLVDVATAARTEVINRELLDALPTPRNSQSFGYLAQGVRLSKPDVGGAQMMEQVNMRVHGASQLHTTMQIDNMLISPAFNDGAIQNYTNQAHYAETTFTTSSQAAEVSAGGIRLNMIPRSGGNQLSGAMYAGVTDGSWQSNNLSQKLKDLGLQSPTGITNIHDVNPAIGGPILRDRLWYFGSMRWMSVDEKVINAYMPDGSQAIVDQYVNIPLLRIEGQVNPNTKVSAFLDRPFKYKGREFTFGIEPAFASRRRNWGEANYHNGGAKLTSTIGSRMLFEAGVTDIVERLHSGYQPAAFPTTQGWPRPANVRTCVNTPCAYDASYDQTGQWFRDVSHFDLVTQQRTVATSVYSGTIPDRRHYTASLSYIGGAHTIKAGIQHNSGQDRNDASSHGDMNDLRYRNGVPESVVVAARPFGTEEYVNHDMGIYLQDTIRYNRLTITPGVRFEYLNAQVKEQWRSAGRFVDGQIYQPVKDVPNWTNVVPRLGATYDVFGDGSTAIKFGANLYTRPMAGSFAKRYNPLRGVETDTRDWFDVELIPGTAQRSGVPRPTDGDNIAQDWEIGPKNNQSFGIKAGRTFVDDLKRETNREYTVSVQRQLFPGLSVTAGWYRRQYYDLIGEDNLLLDPATDYDAFQVVNPYNTSETFTIYNLKREKRGLSQIQEFNSDTDTHISNDLEFAFNSRLPNGSTLFGGLTMMKNVSVTCDNDNPNGFNYSDLYYAITFVRGGRFCDERELSIPYRSDFKLAGTLPLPYGLEFSGTVISFAGNETEAYWDVPASVFPNGQRTQAVRVKLSQPGTLYLERWNQVDVAFKKLIAVGKYNFTAQADVYNLLNGSNITTDTSAFSTTNNNLGFPNTILQGRLLRLVAQVKW